MYISSTPDDTTACRLSQVISTVLSVAINGKGLFSGEANFTKSQELKGFEVVAPFAIDVPITRLAAFIPKSPEVAVLAFVALVVALFTVYR